MAKDKALEDTFQIYIRRALAEVVYCFEGLQRKYQPAPCRKEIMEMLDEKTVEIVDDIMEQIEYSYHPKPWHDLIARMNQIIKDQINALTTYHDLGFDAKHFDNHTRNMARDLLNEVKGDLSGIVDDMVSDEEKVNQLRQFCEPFYTTEN